MDEPRGAGPGFRRPVLVVQSDAFNRSRIETVVAVILTTNPRLLDAPGNVLLPRAASGIARDSVVNVSQIVTLDREMLTERIGKVPPRILSAVGDGIRLVLSL
jgi:mRNA interferase MazF